MSYPLVLDLAADGIPVAVTCRVPGFSKQAFYAWRHNPIRQRDWDEAHLVNAAIDIHADDPAFGPTTPLIRLGNDRYSPKYRESGLSPFLLECAKQGKTGRFEVLTIERVQPPAEIAERLKVVPGTRSVLRRENIFYADDDPVHRVTTYIPWSIAKGTGLLQADVPHQYGIHGVLEDEHRTMTRMREEISVRMPRPDESRYLHLRPGVPVLDVWHTSIDQDGEPYELTQFVMRGDMTGLLYDVPI